LFECQTKGYFRLYPGKVVKERPFERDIKKKVEGLGRENYTVRTKRCRLPQCSFWVALTQGGRAIRNGYKKAQLSSGRGTNSHRRAEMPNQKG